MRRENITFFLSILFLLIINSCTSKKKEIIVETFPFNDSLFANTIKIPCNLLCATKIIATDKHLLIFDKQKTEKFKIFELPLIHYLYSWGKEGKGPEEIKYIDTKTIKGFKDRFIFLDFLKIKTAIVKTDSIKITKTQWLKPQSEPINGLLMVNDSIFIFDRSSKDKFEHTLVNINDDKKSFNFGDFGDNLNIKNYARREQAYLKTKVAKPDGRKIAVFYLFFNKFKLYDSNCRLIKEVLIKNKNLTQTFSVEKYSSNIVYNVVQYATDNYIFVLNPNSSRMDIENGLITYEPHMSVWDWNGNPIAKFKFNKSIVSFTVSEKFKKIYAISAFEMNEIYEFELPKVLNNI